MYGDIKAATDRIAGRIRPVSLTALDPGAIRTAHRDPVDDRDPEACQVWLALEYMQHTGSFKARGALNFMQAHVDAGSLPAAGVTIASGGNAGLACAWAARQHETTATVFLPKTAPHLKIARLRSYGADVRLVGKEYAEAAAACTEFSAASGALMSHAYDHPLIAAGAGTLIDEILHQMPDLDTVVVAVGGGGLLAGVGTAAQHHGVRTIGVEPDDCRALNAAVTAGELVDVNPTSVAADSLGARRASEMALQVALQSGVHSVIVPDQEIVRARQGLWDHRRIAVEHGAATALAALTSPTKHVARDLGHRPDIPNRGYRPSNGEKVVVVLCGANTDPSTLLPVDERRRRPLSAP
jgi:threonine dehydratase